MNIVRSKKKLRSFVETAGKKNAAIGLVPTMGCLHEGHMSLIRRARKQNDIVIVSVFVNPLQFGQHEDLHAYPRTEKEDLEKCEAEKVDIVYLPNAAQFYDEPFLSVIHIRSITEIMCGESRPDHFNGVATVVMKLFQQVQPTHAYFGAKDYQQLIVIKQMVKDFDLNVKIVSCPIVREKDGLAMSSRNRYLDHEQRARALILGQVLCKAAGWIKEGVVDVTLLKIKIKNLISKYADKIDYVEVRDPRTLSKVTTCKQTVVIAVAAFFGKARLIDNKVIQVKREK